MTPENDLKLCTDFPKLFVNRKGNPQETAMCWGFECGDGWFDLIYRLCQSLQWNTDKNKYPQVVVSQVKEKFGQLRFYVDGANDKQHATIDAYCSMSGMFCEQCGERGKVKNYGGWYSCLCPKCATKIEETP